MLAIGIDPGTAICGFGLVEMVGNKLTPIHYGAVFTDKDMLPELRLKKIYDELSVLLDEYRPDVMSVEQLFFNRNVTTAISVGQARGVALLTAANRGIQITEFTPMQIAVPGSIPIASISSCSLLIMIESRQALVSLPVAQFILRLLPAGLRLRIRICCLNSG